MCLGPVHERDVSGQACSPSKAAEGWARRLQGTHEQRESMFYVKTISTESIELQFIEVATVAFFGVDCFLYDFSQLEKLKIAVIW